MRATAPPAHYFVRYSIMRDKREVKHLWCRRGEEVQGMNMLRYALTVTVLMLAMTACFISRAVADIDERFDVPVLDSPVLGAQDALVTIIEFVDYECPHCSTVGPTIHSLVRNYVKDVRLVIKFYPYKYRDNARISSQAAIAAWLQGPELFERMHVLMLMSSPRLERSDLFHYAREAGLDMDRFAQDFDSERVQRIIERDMGVGLKFDLFNTPTFLFNGRLVVGNRPYESFEEILKEELEAARQRAAAAGAAKGEPSR